MNAITSGAGRLVGLLGTVLVTVAAVARLAGYYELAGFGTGTMMLGGIGVTSVGCFLLLWNLSVRDRS